MLPSLCLSVMSCESYDICLSCHVTDIMSMISYHLSVNHVLSSVVKCCHVYVNHMPTPVTCSMCVTILCHHMSFNHMLSCVCHEHAVESVETTHLQLPFYLCLCLCVCGCGGESRKQSVVPCHVYDSAKSCPCAPCTPIHGTRRSCASQHATCRLIRQGHVAVF